MIKTESSGAVFEIILNNPAARNAMDLEFFDGMIAALHQAEDAAIRCVIIRGEGPLFCVGGNLKIFAKVANSGQIIPKSAPDRLHEMIHLMRRLRKPVLALVHGACAGAGLSLALACDLVFAAEGTKFNLAYVGVGLSPDGGSTYFLPRHVGMKKAMEIFLTGQTVDASEALNLGLINRILPVADFLSEGRQLAQVLAMGPTAAYGRLKSLVNQTYHNTLEQQLDAEAQFFSESSGTEDFRGAVNSFLQKQPPVFQGK